MTAITWNAGRKAKMEGATDAGLAWDAWLETDEALQALVFGTTQDLINAQRNFLHAFAVAVQQ